MPHLLPFLLVLSLALAACTSSPTPSARPQTMDTGPQTLPPCPSTPNCVLEARRFAVPPDTLYRQARAALLEIGAREMELAPESGRIDAVFRVFFFKDDVAVQVESDDAGSVLHVRSASRVGHSDLGVNRRRVNRFWRALAATGAQESTSTEAMAK